MGPSSGGLVFFVSRRSHARSHWVLQTVGWARVAGDAEIKFQANGRSMLPTRIEIGHYRALRDCAVALDDNTVLVGQNGAGKSSVLQALRFFFDVASSLSEQDQSYGSDDPVSVTITLDELNAEELAQYAEFLDDRQRLIVTKQCLPGSAARYVVRGMKYPGFDGIRKFSGEGATVFSTAYKQFIDDHPEYGLSKPRSAAECKAELARWEREHPDQLIEADVDFEFQGSTKTQVIATTRLVYVPAVHDVADDFKAGRSPLGQMIEALVTAQLEEKPEIVELRERWDREYQELFGDRGNAELDDLAKRLSTAIGEFVPGASVRFAWEEEHPQVPIPEVRSEISEDGIPTDITHQGHGMQRAMVMALLQAYDEHLRSKSALEDDAKSVAHILLLIEEPELYQHPPRARHIRRVLNKLATEKRGNARFRIVSTTHSPDFVSMDDLETIRIVRKEGDGVGVPRRHIGSITINDVLQAFAERTGELLTEPELRRGLHVLGGALREALFASAVVLTEGVGDVGVLSAESQHRGVDLEAKGVVMAPLGGKGLLPLAIVILSLLGIRHYIVFDADDAARLPENQRLLRLLNAAPADVPVVGAPPTAVRDNYAVLHPEIEDVLKRDFGQRPYEDCIARAATLFGKRPKEVMKNPAAAAHVIDLLHERGLRSQTLEEIIDKLSRL